MSTHEHTFENGKCKTCGLTEPTVLELYVQLKEIKDTLESLHSIATYFIAFVVFGSGLLLFITVIADIIASLRK